MPGPDPDAILYESPIHEQGRRLGEELAKGFGVADHLFFREAARFAPLAPVLSGGIGDPDATMDALVGLGEGCPSGSMLLSLGAHAFAVAAAVAKFAPDATRGALLPELASGARIGGFAATEAKAGSDVMAMDTRYAETRSGFVLNGEKAWITNATKADVFVVFATKDPRLHSRGISAFVVDRSTPGVSSSAVKVDGSAGNVTLGTVVLKDVHVGRDALLGRVNAGAQVFRHSIVQERILLSAFLVGSIRRALRRSIEHAQGRLQFGVPIASNQYVSGRIVDIYRRYATTRLLLQYGIARLERGTATEADASLVKLQCSEAAFESNLDSFRIHGAKGLETAGSEGLIDALSSVTYSGTSDLQRVIIAASLGLQP
jgi:alkylation response protein AidB-like acyl-CoA dehydrogenase